MRCRSAFIPAATGGEGADFALTMCVPGRALGPGARAMSTVDEPSLTELTFQAGDQVIDEKRAEGIRGR